MTLGVRGDETSKVALTLVEVFRSKVLRTFDFRIEFSESPQMTFWAEAPLSLRVTLSLVLA
jgi:hypothetical protein